MNNEFYLQEFIGNNVIIKGSSNSNNVNIKGKIVDETRNMITIYSRGKICKIPKENTIFTIEFDNELHNIAGDFIVIRPEERTKEKSKIYKKIRRYDKNEKYRHRY